MPFAGLPSSTPTPTSILLVQTLAIPVQNQAQARKDRRGLRGARGRLPSAARLMLQPAQVGSGGFQVALHLVVLAKPALAVLERRAETWHDD